MKIFIHEKTTFMIKHLVRSPNERGYVIKQKQKTIHFKCLCMKLCKRNIDNKYILFQESVPYKYYL